MGVGRTDWKKYEVQKQNTGENTVDLVIISGLTSFYTSQIMKGATTLGDLHHEI